MARDSSAPNLRAAAPVDLPEEKPRAKSVFVLSDSTLTGIEEARRTALADRKASLRLLKLRTELDLLQVEVADRGGVSTRTLRRYESGQYDLGALRVYSELLDLLEERSKGRK